MASRTEPSCLRAQISGMVTVNSDTSFTVTNFNYDGQVMPYTALCMAMHLPRELLSRSAFSVAATCACPPQIW